MSLKGIIEGHINEFKAVLGIEDEEKEKIFNSRKNICLNCPLKNGNTCNPSLFIHPKTLEVSKTSKQGYAKGCGCRLSAKQRSPNDKCPAGFWGGEFNK